jgi:hypothetical protein
VTARCVMSRSTRRLTLAASAALVVTVLVGVSPAAATSSCVAQSTLAEHQVYGSAWGHELPGYFASHREVLQEFGFASFGALASYVATQDPNNCPPDL